MAKAPVKKTPAKKTGAKKPSAMTAAALKAAAKKTAAAEAAADAAAPVAKKVAKPRKAAAPKAAAPVDNRITAMHGETRLTHTGGGAEALAALIPAIDAVNAGSKVRVTSAAHGPEGVDIHAVPTSHEGPYDLKPGVILRIGANGLMAFDHVAVGLATPGAIEETVLSVMDAVRPVDGAEPTATGRRADWFEQAVLAAETMAERLAA